MYFSFLSDLLQSPWQIDGITFSNMYPAFKGMLNGLSFEVEKPKESFYLSSKQAVTVTERVQRKKEDSQEDYIFVLPVSGILTKHDQPCGPYGTRTLGQMLMDADSDERVIGHIILVESGGGQSTAVPEIAEAIKSCTKPVVAWIDGIAGSAAYYFITYCSWIIASRPTDWVGCIGTLIEYQGHKAIGSTNSENEVIIRVYADGAEEKNQEYEEAINNGNTKLVKENILNPINAQFHADVKANRTGVKPEHLKGKTFTADKVVGSLIDEIGPFQKAIEAVLRLADYNPDQPKSKSSQKKLSNSNSINMTKPNLSALIALLAVSNIEINEGGAFLTVEQLEAISKELETIPGMKTQLQAAQNDKAKAETDLKTANDTIAQRDATITGLQKDVEELKQEPGSKGAKIKVENDNLESGAGKSVAKGNDFAADLAAVAQEYFGKEI